MKTKHWTAFFAIIFLAACLRMYGAASRDIWYDDAFSILLSRQPFAAIVSGTAADTMPPLYYFLLHFWQLIGQDLLTLRLLGVLLSVGTVIVIFDLGRRLGGITVGLCSALVVAIMPFQIYHAQELRMYALLELTQIMYVWFFVRLLKNITPSRNVGLWSGLVLAGTLAMYSHNLAIFGLIIPNLYLLLKKQWRMLGQLVLAQILIASLATPWLLVIPGQINKIETAFWTPRPGLLEIFQGLMQFNSFLPMTGPILIISALFSVQAMVIVGIESWKARKIEGVCFLKLVWIGLPAILFGISYFMRPIFVPRGFILSMVAFAILASWMIAININKPIGPFLAAIVFIPAIVSLPSYYSYSGFPRSPFEQAADYLASSSVSGDVILHDNKLSYFPSIYYKPELNQVFLADEPGSHNDTLAYASQKAMNIYPVSQLDEAIGNRSRIWFVLFSKAIQEYLDAGLPDHPVLARLKAMYPNDKSISFGDLEIHLFSR